MLREWIFGQQVLWSHLEVLKTINDNRPIPWALENHHQKTYSKEIFTELSELTKIFGLFWEAQQPDDD